MTGREWLRRAFHMLPGFLPVALWFVPHRVPLSPLLRGIVLGVVVALAGLVWREWRSIRRLGESTRAARGPAVLGYAGGVLLPLLLFPDRPECAFAALAVLAFGDGSATLVAKLLGGARRPAPLPWNPDKSWAGLAAFLTFGGLTAAAWYRGESLNVEAVTPPAGWPTAFAVTAPAVLLAGLWESRRSPLNDNVRVAVAASLGVLIAHAARVGGF